MSESQRLQMKHITKFLIYLVNTEIRPLTLSIVDFTQLFSYIWKKKLNKFFGFFVCFWFVVLVFFSQSCHNLLIEIAETRYKKKQPNPKPPKHKNNLHFFYPQTISQYVEKVSLSKTIFQFYNHFICFLYLFWSKLNNHKYWARKVIL